MLLMGRRIMRGEAIDVIQAQDPSFTGSVARLLSRSFKVPYNVCVYGANPFDPYWVRESVRSRLIAGVSKRVVREAHGLQVDGTATQRSLIDAGIPVQRVSIKPMIPRNIEEFLTAVLEDRRRETLLGSANCRRLVLFVGRLVAPKSLGTWLQVAALVTARRDDVRFVCVGDGPERERLQKQTRRLGLGEVVRWMGAVPHQEVPKCMAACDLFLLTSRYEGFARVLMEAAAAGKPVVTTAVSGADDGVIDGVSGCIRRIDDVDGLARAVIELLGDPERMAQMGLAGQRHIRSLAARYSNAEQQIRIWHRVAAGSPELSMGRVGEERASTVVQSGDGYGRPGPGVHDSLDTYGSR
jgi:glycosyltransferase involved in cell wall biosynthesis